MMNHFENNYSNKLSGICSLLIGVLYIFLIIYAVAIPTGQRYEPGQFFMNYAQSPAAMSVAWIVMAATSILAIVIVLPIGVLIHSEISEWMRLATSVGLVGFATATVSFLTMLGKAPGLAQAYIAGDSATRAAIAAIGLPQLDPWNVLVLGGVGTWLLVVNIYALQGRTLTRLHAVIGVGLAVFHLVAVVAAIIQSEGLDQIAAGAGAILAPIWYGWMGIRMYKKST
jgi:hypothetical protein